MWSIFYFFLAFFLFCFFPNDLRSISSMTCVFLFPSCVLRDVTAMVGVRCWFRFALLLLNCAMKITINLEAKWHAVLMPRPHSKRGIRHYRRII